MTKLWHKPNFLRVTGSPKLNLRSCGFSSSSSDFFRRARPHSLSLSLIDLYSFQPNHNSPPPLHVTHLRSPIATPRIKWGTPRISALYLKAQSQKKKFARKKTNLTIFFGRTTAREKSTKNPTKEDNFFHKKITLPRCPAAATSLESLLPPPPAAAAALPWWVRTTLAAWGGGGGGGGTGSTALQEVP